MVVQDDAKKWNTLACGYKTSVVAKNSLYVGNVKQADKVYADRMIKSPINQYNILPASNIIPIAINDGDEITALEYYKDKILQFKRQKVFVLNIAGDNEFLEDTFGNVGVLQQCSVARTPHGIVWANSSGCYLYDGSKLVNLIDGKIPVTSDYASITNNFWIPSGGPDRVAAVAYIRNRD